MQVRSELLDNELQAPSKIPKEIRMVKEPVAPPPTLGAVGMEGVTDGTRSDAMNAIFNGIGAGHASVGRAAPPQKVSISSGVMAGNLLDKVTPQYPAIAKAARIQGHSCPAGHNFQSRHHSKPPGHQRTSYVATGGVGCGPFLAL